ncbi:MAG TPA: GlsB/YeaQ/YmgE family stress response membrane protein [Ensifer sp.]|uniref:GlsB/YeaQ/YmgE family stress response membrane protein n=1 Tax=Ensifer sp. TaxID=1872086 RepID=UPI002E166597|nr:GlsB/YeaQ/YmgE family stress response membrane protein [Ensifer sp.]HEV7318296.1 GlsB/YeaQ/YmgE family stress response membrane protein [Ensifer sp.]
MSVNGVGILAAIIIGGLAGWLAERFMNSDMGLFMNILLGIIGAVVLNFILAAFGMVFAGWVAYLVIGFIGACLLIAVGRAVKR